MVNLLPFLDKLRFPNFVLKVKLGVLLLCSTFLLDYQPTLAFPPIKRNVVYAEIVQEQSVSIETSPVVFQLPHPGYITTRFSNYHPGIDLCSGLGMPIKPISKGTVVEAGYSFFGLGLVVEVEHENGYRSLYAHMGKIYVNKGDFVDSENYIGEIGMTGNTSGPHTHLELTKDGKKIDPLLILPEIRDYPAEEDNAVPHSDIKSTISIPAAKPVSSESAQMNYRSSDTRIKTPVATQVAKEVEKTAEKTTEEKPVEIDIPKQNVENIINTASPKPSVAPMPQGGKLSLRNFSLFGLKKH